MFFDKYEIAYYSWNRNGNTNWSFVITLYLQSAWVMMVTLSYIVKIILPIEINEIVYDNMWIMVNVNINIMWHRRVFFFRNKSMTWNKVASM